MAARNPKVTATSDRVNTPGDEEPVDVPVDRLAGPDASTQEGAPAIGDTVDDDGAPDYVAVQDLVSWREPIAGTVPQRFRTLRRFVGQPIPSTIPDDQRDRLLDAGAIAAAGADAREVLAARAEAGRPTVPAGEVGDNELSGWAQPNLVAYVTQFPTEAERVNRIERSRPGGPRAAVVRAAGYDPETGDRLD